MFTSYSSIFLFLPLLVTGICIDKALGRRNRGPDDLSLRWVFEKYFIFLLAVAAGYNLIFETTDSLQYSGYYDSITEEKVFGEHGFEPLYNALSSIAKLVLHIEYEVFATILAFISLNIKFNILKKSDNAVFLKYVYVVTLYFVFESLRLRSAFAISFCYLAIYQRESLWRSWVLLIFACLFHYSALIFCPILLFNKKLEDKNYVLGAILLSGAVLVVLSQVLHEFLFYDRFAAYILNNPDYFNTWGIPRVLILFSIVICVLKKRMILSKDGILNLYIGGVTTIAAALFFKYSLLSIAFIDLSILSFFLLIGDRAIQRWSVAYLLFWLLVIEQLATRVLDVPRTVLILMGRVPLSS